MVMAVIGLKSSLLVYQVFNVGLCFGGSQRKSVDW